MIGKQMKIALGLFIILSIPLTFLLFSKQVISSEDILTVDVKSEKIDSGILLESEMKEADYFKLTLEYPITTIETVDELIKAWVHDQERFFYEQLEPVSFFNAKKSATHLTLKTDIYKINDHILSFVLHATHQINDIQKSKQTKAFVVHLKESEPINIEDVIQINDENKDALKEAIFNADSSKGLTETIIDETLHNIADINWAFKKEHFNFYFSKENKDENNRVITIQLDYKTMKPFLTNTYKSVFFPEEKVKKKSDKKQEKKKEKKKLVAITFDDGPDANITPQILNTLEKHDAKATFFMLSKNAKSNPKTAKLVVDKGHEIANHSINHRNLNASKKTTIETEILQSQKDIEKVTGVKPTLFRPPYGEYNQNVINFAAESEQTVVMWSVDSRDWKLRNKQKIMNEIKNKIRPNSMILLHDIHQPTADTVDSLVSYLKKSGYELVTVSELLTHIEPHVNGVYYGH